MTLLRSLSLAITIGVLLAAPLAASAHQLGCDGKPVPEDVKASCCGKADGHQVPAGDLHEDDNGVWHIIIGGVDYPIVYRGTRNGILALDSRDGCSYVWYQSYGLGSSLQITFYCLMLPLDL